MKQYLELLNSIKQKGTHKPPAREGMPGSLSLFGYQFRHDLSDGFPLLTTKKMFFKGVVVELLWFLRGDTNIKYLVDNGVNIWNEDAYNYYLQLCNNGTIGNDHVVITGQNPRPFEFEEFIDRLKNSGFTFENRKTGFKYSLGDCGYQYGKVWRDWDGELLDTEFQHGSSGTRISHRYKSIDQIKNVINSLRNTPESRRHIVTAIDPAHDQDLALYWCHALFQFNCRPRSREEIGNDVYQYQQKGVTNAEDMNIPTYYLDCQLYQRSADVFLGVPFNIASYALLTHIIAKICNMIPGEFIHTFGDVHIYDSHLEVVEEQLKREPYPLPRLKMTDNKALWRGVTAEGLDLSFEAFTPDDFVIEDYQHHPALKAKLSTGLF